MARSKSTSSQAPAESLDLILRALPAFVIAVDTKLNFTTIKGAVLGALGLGEDAIARLIGKPAERFFTGPEGHLLIEHARAALDGKPSSFEASWYGRWFFAHVAPVYDAHNRIAGAVGVGMDITQRRKLARELDEERFALTEAQRLAELGSWILDIPSGEIRVSPELARLLGIPHPKEPVQFSQIACMFHPDDMTLIEDEKNRALRDCGPYDFAHRIVAPDGTVRYVRSRGNVQCDSDGRPLRCIGTMLDITQLTQARRFAELLAYHDPLTGLPNRWLLSERLQRAIAGARRDRQRFYLLFIDLDNFKRINDSLGHAEGDVLLTQVGQRLRSATRETDTVARTGGDEFVVLLTEIDDDEQAETAIAKIQGLFKKPFSLRGGAYFITGSIGVAAYPEDAHTEREVLQRADLAMYDAKRAGRNAVRRYHGGSGASLMARVQLELELSQAFSHGEFRIHYQPIVDAQSQNIVGVEALLRWQHPTRGLLTPKFFIEVMEASEFVAPIGEWVLREASTQVAQWRERFGIPLRLSVNVSARQMLREQKFPQLVVRALQHSQLSPNALELEITETAIVRDLEWATAILSEIRDLGIGIAIDDFGTGYNSLSYLKHFPVTALKIDRSFVGEIGVDAFDEAISFAVAALGKALRIRVVAEGVETLRQCDALSRFGCDELQGFFFAPPLETAQMEERIASGALGV